MTEGADAMHDGAERLRAISRELHMSDLVLKLACSQANNEGRPPVSARTPQELSPIKRNWGLEFLSPQNESWEPNRVHFAWRFKGSLRVDCLTRAARELARRHPLLCCSLRHTHGGWRFVSGLRQPPDLPVCDLTSTSTSSPDAEKDVIDRLRDFIRLPFTGTDFALRVAHGRIADEDHLIGLAIHHSFCDAYSMRIVSYEIGALYDAFCRGLESPLPEVPIQYLDHMAALDEWSRGPEASAQIAFWLRYMDGAIGLTPPRERQVAMSTFQVSAKCSEALSVLSRRERVAPVLAWEALHHATLYRLLRQNDVTTLSVDSGRRQKELIPLVGELVNLVPLRTELSGTLTFRELLRRMRDARARCQAYLSTPYELVAEHRPDFTCGFGATNYIPRTFATFETFGPQVPVPMELFCDVRPPYAYVVAVVEDAAGISVRCIGDNPTAFTIAELANTLELVADKAILSPDNPLSSMPS
jgi:hypothetical protein